MKLALTVLLRAGIPLLIMGAISIALFAQGKPPDARATLAVAVIAAAVSGASVIYQIDSWSLRAQTLLHFAVMIVTVLPALLLSGWFPVGSVWDYVGVVGVFLVGGIVLWTGFFVLFTKILPRRAAARTRT